jgi:Coenzyme PQQ synthesis protein D (PqqD)
MAAFTTNPQVIHETIDGETIIIDLASGSYYSLQGSGPEIWNGLAEGETLPALTQRLTASYGESQEIKAALATFLRELEAEQLIQRGEETVTEEPRTLNGGGGGAPEAPFVPPKLEKYTDMQDIILLDPVHEVDARGWPHAPAGT